MRENHDQLNKTQLLGMMLFGLCVWAIFIGIVWAVMKNVLNGMIITIAGVIGSVVIFKWLVYINKDRPL